MSESVNLAAAGAVARARSEWEALAFRRLAEAQFAGWVWPADAEALLCNEAADVLAARIRDVLGEGVSVSVHLGWAPTYDPAVTHKRYWVVNAVAEWAPGLDREVFSQGSDDLFTAALGVAQQVFMSRNGQLRAGGAK